MSFLYKFEYIRGFPNLHYCTFNNGKYFRKKSSLAYLPPALQVSANLIQELPFYLKLNFSEEKLRETVLARYS